jgi:hypothetical protein
MMAMLKNTLSNLDRKLAKIILAHRHKLMPKWAKLAEEIRSLKRYNGIDQIMDL